MPQAATIYRILIASPSDCIEERKVIPQVISSWNASHSLATAAVIEPILWETHVIPELGDRPQAIINKQIVEACDILVGVFWTRLGSDTGKAVSGTAEEIEEIRRNGKKALLYFSKAPVILDSIDLQQYQALQTYKKSVQKEGITFDYISIADLREQFQRHLSALMASMHRVSPEKPDDGKDEIHNISYNQLVTSLYKVVDKYAHYSSTPPTASLEEYAEKEQVVKDWLFENKMECDSEIYEKARATILKIRRFTEAGNMVKTLLGGDGRPSKKDLTLQLQELEGDIDWIDKRVRDRKS